MAPQCSLLEQGFTLPKKQALIFLGPVPTPVSGRWGSEQVMDVGQTAPRQASLLRVTLDGGQP